MSDINSKARGVSPRRMVRTWLPAELVRTMDSVIEASGGAFVDRSEFIADAIRDRIAEELHSRDEVVPHSTIDARDAAESDQNPTAASDEQSRALSPAVIELGDWSRMIESSNWTLPAALGPDSNWGMHNRDLPTIFALDILGRLVVSAEAPVRWDDFLRVLASASWETGTRLLAFDKNSGAPLKSATGFPTNVSKRDGSERRFLAHAAGTAKPKGNNGPLFVFRFVGLTHEPEPRVSPTKDACILAARLAEAGLSEGPPFSANAWNAFRDYLKKNAPMELNTWMRVIALLVDHPTRDELIARCDWWSGSLADTNSMGFIARAREWGLVSPRMIEGRYALTEFGEEEVSANERP